MKKQLSAAFLTAALLLGACGIDKKLDDAAEAMRNEEYVKAINFYEDVLDDDAANIEAYKGLIKASLLDGRGDNALQYYNEAEEKMDPADFRELKHQREKIEKKTSGVLDSIHSALLTVMMDPEIVNRTDYAEVFRAWSENTVHFSVLESSSEWKDYTKAVFHILGVRKTEDVMEDILVYGEMEPNLCFRFENVNRLKVWIEGHEDELYVK
ncbi:MAG: hypothetical protein K5697_05075 [Lachnospiraceae bacterium]|nr:hypothetical protein [Lachnospiraceae bacterium]